MPDPAPQHHSINQSEPDTPESNGSLMKPLSPCNISLFSARGWAYLGQLLCLSLLTALLLGTADHVVAYQKGMGGENPVIAHIAGEAITIQDIEDKQINDLRAELHGKLQDKLQILALRKLAAQYPEYQLDYQPTITDQAIRDFYVENNLQRRGSLEALSSRIKALLQMKAVADYYTDLYQKAVERGLIVSYLKEPNDFMVRVPVETAYLWGGKDASVMVLEFSDYQCPFCSRVQETIRELRKIYRNRVVFGYRHSPLAFHREADEAAIAVECARDQGRFKPYHNILFDHYHDIRIENLERFAKQAAVPDMKEFKSCLKNERYRSRIENDQQAAAAAGIKGTPGFVIGRYHRKEDVVIGEVLSGAQPRAAFTRSIEKYLEKRQDQ